MINENQFTSYYEKIANQLNSIIPSEWNEIAMYAEELGDTRTFLFYYKKDSDSEFIYSGNIPELYGVSRKVYFELLKELSMIVKY